VELIIIVSIISQLQDSFEVQNDYYSYFSLLFSDISLFFFPQHINVYNVYVCISSQSHLYSYSF